MYKLVKRSKGLDVKTAIEQRRTIHEFSGDNVESEVIDEALKLALWAPNHKLTYPWKFYKIGCETKEKLIDLAVKLKIKTSEKAPSEMMLKNLRAKLESCSHMIAVGLKRVDDAFQQREDYATVACGVQNVCLYLHTQGVGSKWSTGGFTRAKETYEILGIEPNEIEIVGVLLVGKAKVPPRIPPRPALAEVAEERP